MKKLLFLLLIVSLALGGTAWAAKEELRGLRHILFAGMMGLGLLVYLQLYPAIHRVAQCLRREAAQEA